MGGDVHAATSAGLRLVAPYFRVMNQRGRCNTVVCISLLPHYLILPLPLLLLPVLLLLLLLLLSGHHGGD
jgi:hypothetical protein